MIMYKIKHHIVTPVMLLALLAGCTSDGEILHQSPDRYIVFGRPSIAFESEVAPMSRATLATDMTSFKVYGFCIPKNISGEPNPNSAPLEWEEKSIFFTGGPDIFNGVEVNVKPDGSTTYSPGPVAWNSVHPEWRYSFIATSNTGDGTWSYTPANGYSTQDNPYGPRLTYTLPGTISGNVSKDVMPDGLIAARFDHQSTDGRVDMTFSHFMTGLRFKFHNHTDKELTVTSMSMSGDFYKTAVFDFTAAALKMSVDDTQKYSATFNLLDRQQTIAAGSADYILSHDAAGSSHNAALLLIANPDADKSNEIYALGSNKVIKITFSFDGGVTTKEFIEKNLILNYQPLPGTLHTAHFNFVGDDFIVFFQADNDLNWQNGSDATHTIQ